MKKLSGLIMQYGRFPSYNVKTKKVDGGCFNKETVDYLREWAREHIKELRKDVLDAIKETNISINCEPYRDEETKNKESIINYLMEMFELEGR